MLMGCFDPVWASAGRHDPAQTQGVYTLAPVEGGCGARNGFLPFQDPVWSRFSFNSIKIQVSCPHDS